MRTANPSETQYVVADRDDGLGGRLTAIMCAMQRADRLGCEFRFTWKNTKLMDRDEFHQLATAEQLFSTDFLKRYRLKNLEGITCASIFEPSAPAVDFADFEAGADLRQYFERLEFAAPYREAIELARTVKIEKNAAAIHLRTGDIVFGENRLVPHLTDKVVSLPLARKTAEMLTKSGTDVIVFGQDPFSLEQFVSVGARPAGDYLPPNLNDATQRDLFEVVLMSRFKRIYAGSSVYPRLASMIGGSRLIDPIELYDARQTMDLVNAEPDEGSTEQDLSNAYARKQLYYRFRDELDGSSRLALLREARELDFDNFLYSLHLASELIRAGDLAGADTVIGDLLLHQDETEKRLPSNAMISLAKVRPFANQLDEDRRVISEATGSGFGHIDLFGAYVRFIEGDRKAALKTIWKARKRVAKPELAYRLFFRLSRKAISNRS